MTPYYQDSLVTLYCGDCLELFTHESQHCTVLVTDPPYGINFEGRQGALPAIVGDTDTSLRDAILSQWHGKPAIVFGSWKVQRPDNCVALLVWDKGDHVGMGDLSLPWKPNTEEIYVIGSGFYGHRDSSVIRVNAPVSWNSVGFGRVHPNEKPIPLLAKLLAKCPLGPVIDPCCGSGSTLRAAKDSGRKAVGIEIEERYCEITANRLRQGTLSEMFTT